MKQRMIWLLTALLAVLLLTPCGAAANRVPEMEIEVALRSDGSAHIVQTWTAETDEGTECYLACNDSGYLTITDFSVSDAYGPYAFVENWNVSATFDDKAGKCGIVRTKDGVELCWGITQYGRQRYTIEYVLHGLVGAYAEADGFNHCFVDEMGTFPTNVTLTIRNEDGTPITDEFADIWAFGYDGQVVFEDGIIRAWTEAPLEAGDYMTIMVGLEKGRLSPARMVEGDFEDVKAMALIGSDYDYDVELTWLDYVLYLVIMAVRVGFIVLIIFVWVKFRRFQKNRWRKNVEYFRDVPNNGNLNVSHKLGLCSKQCKDDTLLGAYMLRLVSQGCLETTDVTIDHGDALCLRLCHPPVRGTAFDEAMYTVLEAAAGEDGLLQPKELQNFCNQRETPLVRFIRSCEDNAMETLEAGGCLKKKGRLEKTSQLTESGRKELSEILGLKKFLLDFSLIRERGVAETVIWQDYMVYALLTGIADKVEKQIRDLYPDYIPQLDQYQRYIRSTRYYNDLMYNSYFLYHAYSPSNQTRRSSGSGGRASRRGGGGRSGGGGGGTR